MRSAPIVLALIAGYFSLALLLPHSKSQNNETKNSGPGPSKQDASPIMAELDGRLYTGNDIVTSFYVVDNYNRFLFYFPDRTDSKNYILVAINNNTNDIIRKIRVHGNAYIGDAYIHIDENCKPPYPKQTLDIQPYTVFLEFIPDPSENLCLVVLDSVHVAGVTRLFDPSQGDRIALLTDIYSSPPPTKIVKGLADAVRDAGHLVEDLKDNVSSWFEPVR